MLRRPTAPICISVVQACMLVGASEDGVHGSLAKSLDSFTVKSKVLGSEVVLVRQRTAKDADIISL